MMTSKTSAANLAFATDWLKRHSSKRNRDAMARYAIPSDKALGVSVRDIRDLGKKLGRDHGLTEPLWKTDIYEARMLVPFVAEPEKTTSAQMERWCRGFDSWAICDAMSFHLFDRTAHAWSKVHDWAARDEEFVKRAAFAVLWGLTVHDKVSDDAKFVDGLRLIERASMDERNFVKKAVNMALRAIGKRNGKLHQAAVEVARRLAASSDAIARWIGKDALRELTSPSVMKRLARRSGTVKPTKRGKAARA
jgi:3-methyladenine DNA glycosylase AlkD